MVIFEQRGKISVIKAGASDTGSELVASFLPYSEGRRSGPG